MGRKHFLKRMGLTMLHGGFPDVLNEFINACNTKNKKLTAVFFLDEEFQLIEMITDIILPPTSAPGALETQVPYFIDLVIKKCVSNHDQQLIKKGLQELNEQAGRKFSLLPKEEQLSIIKQLEQSAIKGDADKAWFRIFKKLVTIGYFASKDGAQKALQYVQVPGENNGCVPYATGDKTLDKTYLMYW